VPCTETAQEVRMSVRSLLSLALLSLLTAGPAAATPSPRPQLDLPQLLGDLQRIQIQTRLELARQHLDAGRPAEALALLREGLGRGSRPELLFEMARCSLRLGKLQQALGLHRRYVATFGEPLQRLLAAARFGELLDDARRAAASASPAR
jgi:hypothetical protein